MSSKKVQWKIHTEHLLQEVLSNPGTAILSAPINILGKLLAEVADRAVELNDPKLNALMIRLTLYSVADPYSPDYDKAVCDEVLAAADGGEHEVSQS